MCSFTPHFTQGGLALHPGANGGLNQVTALGGVLMGGTGYALPLSAASAVVGFKVTGEVQLHKVLFVQCQLNDALDGRNGAIRLHRVTLQTPSSR